MNLIYITIISTVEIVPQPYTDIDYQNYDLALAYIIIIIHKHSGITNVPVHEYQQSLLTFL